MIAESDGLDHMFPSFRDLSEFPGSSRASPERGYQKLTAQLTTVAVLVSLWLARPTQR